MVSMQLNQKIGHNGDFKYSPRDFVRCSVTKIHSFNVSCSHFWKLIDFWKRPAEGLTKTLQFRQSIPVLDLKSTYSAKTVSYNVISRGK